MCRIVDDCRVVKALAVQLPGSEGGGVQRIQALGCWSFRVCGLGVYACLCSNLRCLDSSVSGSRGLISGP